MLHAETQDGFPISIPATFHGYNVIQLLGCGSTCIVILVEDEKTQQRFSAKIISKKDVQNRNMLKAIINEIKVLQTLDHPHIIKVQEAFDMKNEDEEEYYVIIMEYCSNGDLLSYATGPGFKSEAEKKKILTGFLEAIKYLHNNGISHGDIKSENILLDDFYSPKLCDFGFCRLSQFAGDDSKNGTLYYAAPELFVKGQFDTFKTDIWAIGITLYSLAELQFPFKDGDQNCIVRQILNARLSIRQGMEPKLRALVERCTVKNPELRPTIDDVLHDPYLFIGESSGKKNNISKKKLFNQCIQETLQQEENAWNSSSLYDNVESFEPVFTI
ncbi:hypothetical protein M9Y10_040736 [Tritrichomonas musculus]|uniref:Protein kinase domain-containing protein n=1 Tax=Tritrichomonas musculus TaxID=1915356 RepID=A0ABR2K5E9_9EUKA